MKKIYTKTTIFFYTTKKMSIKCITKLWKARNCTAWCLINDQPCWCLVLLGQKSFGTSTRKESSRQQQLAIIIIALFKSFSTLQLLRKNVISSSQKKDEKSSILLWSSVSESFYFKTILLFWRQNLFSHFERLKKSHGV